MKTRPTVDYALGLKRCSKCTRWLNFEHFRKAPHKNGGCGMHSSCNDCLRATKRARYVPVAEPKVQRKQHIFEVGTRRELRQCSHCLDWAALSAFFMHAHLISNICKPCERERSREYARANIAKHVANAKRWAAANHDRIKARKPRYQRKYAEANRTRIRTRMQGYMRVKSKTPEYLAYQREWAQRTGKGAEKAARRRALQMGAVIGWVERNAIIKRDGRICYLCCVKVKWREVTLDHVIPLSRGGSHTPENLRVACGPCNFSKQDRLLTTLPLGI